MIDDSELARTAIVRLLEDAGFEVHQQESAVGAIANIKRLEIDLAVVDVHLPQIMGDQFVGMLRKNSALTSVRVVMITGEEDETALAAIGAQARAHAILPKSKLTSDLVRTVRELVGIGSASSTGAATGSSSSSSSSTGAMPAADRRKRLKVLIVDDDATVAAITAKWLEAMGHAATVHDRPLGTLTAVAAQRPDVVLLDVVLPLLGGEELALILRKNRLLRELRVIFYSALPADELAALLARSPALGAIRKDGDARSFAQQFNELLGLK